jgi:hypothetical protein
MVMTATEIQEHRGRHAIVQTGQEALRVEVVILDVKNSYGRIRTSIVPVTGDPAARPVWVDFDRLELLDPVPRPRTPRGRCDCHPGATHAPSRCPAKADAR